MLKLGVVYGGISSEHLISEMSAKSVIENLDKQKYEVHEIYISEYGKWYECKGNKKEEIYNLIWYLKDLDVVFPILHGKGGEDGTIQGLFETFQIPYVGCGLLASSIGMDKVYSKIIFEKAGISQVPYSYIRKKNDIYTIINDKFEEEEFDIEKIISRLQFPMFIKPSNGGSSIGIRKVKNKEELKMAIENASQYDEKILIEQGVEAKEVECAILGEELVSTVGEIISGEEFYSFDAKYNMPESKIVIPANIEEEQIKEIQRIAKKAFCAIDGRGLARIDFFIEKETNKIFINEINTMPGFTEISMYPKLFENYGMKYSEILDKLINNVIKN